MSDAETYLDALFSDVEQYVAVRFGRDRDGVERRYWWPNQRAELVVDAHRESDVGRDVYAAPAGRFTDARRKGDGRPRPWAWVDVDHPLDDEQDALARKLDGVTVLSGSPGARHLYVRLTRPVGVAQSEALNRALRDRLDGDAKWSDESLLRLPGTLNHKSSPPRPVVLEHVGAAVWDPDDLAALLGVPDGPTSDRTTSQRHDGGALDAEPAPDPLPDEVTRALARRADEFREGRSGAHHNLVGEARRAGLTLGQTVTVAAGYLPSAQKYGDRLPSEVARSWATVDTGPVLLGGTDTADDEPDSWAPVDLGPYLRGEIVRATPTVGLARRDGLRLLYPGKEHSVIGEMESGKSWVCLACVAAELTAGHRVVYAHFEEADPSDTLDRLRALGVTPAELVERFRFVGPERPVTSEALAALLDPAPSLVILDGVNEAMGLHGWDTRDENGVVAFRRYLVKPCTRVGAAVLSADHVVKDAERRGRSALGSVHKVNGLSGTLLLLENAEPFGREQRGRSHLFVTKDRPGHLRRHGRSSAAAGKTFIGELVVDDTQQTSPDLVLALYGPRDDGVDGEAPTPAGVPGAPAVLEVLAGLPNQTAGSERTVYAAVRKAGHSLRDKAIRDALDDLVLSGQVQEVPGRRGARGYRLATAAQDHHH